MPFLFMKMGWFFMKDLKKEGCNGLKYPVISTNYIKISTYLMEPRLPSDPVYITRVPS
jgi:hypothetical protein